MAVAIQNKCCFIFRIKKKWFMYSIEKKALKPASSEKPHEKGDAFASPQPTNL
jgi:hypothetical protein